MNVSRTCCLLLLVVAIVANAADQYDEHHRHHLASRSNNTAASEEATDRPTASNDKPSPPADHPAKQPVEDAVLQLLDINRGSSEPNINRGSSEADFKQVHKRAAQEFYRLRRRNFPSTFTVWQQPVYPVHRPYVIPVLGTAGGMPIYFPPQQVYIRRPPPSDPRQSYLPPMGYLPPAMRTTTIGYDGEVDVPIVDRNFDPDAPVWDFDPPMQPPSRATTPPPMMRRTRRPNVRTTSSPPLIHRSKNETNQRPMVLRPQRPQKMDGSIFAGSPVDTQPPPTPAPTQAPTEPPPSRCVWAIITCCSVYAKEFNHECFQQMNCPGPFWDRNPCDKEYLKAAVDITQKFYKRG